jgi:DNA-binding CsgD family transcriptional regulator
MASIIGTGSAQSRQQKSLSVANHGAQLKSIFEKTDTHRQSELVALLSLI